MALTSEAREQMVAYLVEEAFFTRDEAERLSDDELSQEYRLMMDEIDDMETISDPESRDPRYRRDIDSPAE